MRYTLPFSSWRMRLGALALFPALLVAQTPGAPGKAITAGQASNPAAQTAANPPAEQKKLPRAADRRRAAKLFLQAGKLFLAKQYEQAVGLYSQAASLDPTNKDYALAVGVARSHAVTALVQQAAQQRLRGDAVGARVSLVRAMGIEPHNPIAP